MTSRDRSLVIMGIITLFLIVGCNNSTNTNGAVESITHKGWALVYTSNGSVVMNQDGNWTLIAKSGNPRIPISKEHSDRITQLCVSLLNNFHVDSTQCGGPGYDNVVIMVGFKRQVSYTFATNSGDLPSEAIELKTLIGEISQ